MTGTVLVVDDASQVSGTEASVSFFAAVDRAICGEDKTLLAFDCEGVNLSRAGSLEVVSLCFEDSTDVVYLVDLGSMGDASLREERVAALQKLLECQSVTKVIHDCRMDCDALFHLCGIEVRNVHDTSCFHWVITRRENVNLNDTLEANDIDVNAARDKSIYKTNPAFWATRPMSDRMVEWASSDVDKLLLLASKQTSILDDVRGEDKMQEARTKSETYAKVVREMMIKTTLSDSTLRVRGNIGHFIGKGGSNIRDLEKRSGAYVYNFATQGAGNQWMVFYSSEAGLRTVRRAMEC